MLTGYRIMWLAVMFDLPVIAPEQRKAANDFRLTLKDMGFEMTQLSVYMRYCTSHSQFDTYCKRVEAALPPGGKVNILHFTDKQYERILTFHGGKREQTPKAPDQFALF